MVRIDEDNEKYPEIRGTNKRIHEEIADILYVRLVHWGSPWVPVPIHVAFAGLR